MTHKVLANGTRKLLSRFFVFDRNTKIVRVFETSGHTKWQAMATDQNCRQKCRHTPTPELFTGTADEVRTLSCLCSYILNTKLMTPPCSDAFRVYLASFRATRLSWFCPHSRRFLSPLQYSTCVRRQIFLHSCFRLSSFQNFFFSLLPASDTQSSRTNNLAVSCRDWGKTWIG